MALEVARMPGRWRKYWAVALIFPQVDGFTIPPVDATKPRKPITRNSLIMMHEGCPNRHPADRGERQQGAGDQQLVGGGVEKRPEDRLDVPAAG